MRLFSALYQSHDPFGLFDEVVACASPSQMDTDGCLLLHGGEDISPSIYGEKKGYFTQVSGLTPRDEKEIKLYNYCIENGIFMIGICRGLQLLSALNGARLIQDTTDHAGRSHKVKTWDNQVCEVNSLHHQMVYPWDLPEEDYKLLMYSKGISKHYLNGDDEDINFSLKAIDEDGLIIEPEAIYYPKTRCLGVQFHPEMMGWRSWEWNLDKNSSDVHTLDYLNNLTKTLYYESNYFDRIAKEQTIF